jgi:hypothetical protein
LALFSAQDLELPHLLDAMHIEKNIIVSMFRTLSNAKGAKSDSLAVRQELQSRNMMPALHPRETTEMDRDGNPIYNYAKPAPWVWSSNDFKLVLGILKNIRAPSNYGSSLAYKIGDKNMVGLKTHDWHNILHDLLPIAIRGTLTEGVRETVYRLSSFFKKVCAKIIRIDDIPGLQEEAAELACYMEMNLPPSFFFIKTHHIVHIPLELFMAGPVRPRWMYFVERYLHGLKGMVRQMARPESCIAEGYITQEAIRYVAQFCPDLDPKWGSQLLEEEDSQILEELLPTSHVEKQMTEVVYEQAHKFVLLNHPAMEKWIERHDTIKQQTSSVAPFRHWVKGAVLQAMDGGEFIPQIVLDLSSGPSATAKYYVGTL